MAKYKIIPSSRTIVQSPISIGHKAEKGVEAIEFDLTAWVETYGSGTLTVIMRRWGDAIPYPIALEIDENNKATWTLSDTDTARAGMAYAQLNYIVGDEVVKKSDIYTFRVMDSLTGEGEPPEAYESWLEHLTHFAAEAMAEVLDIEDIPTDKTLTVDGGIADAKATGDALSALEDAVTEETDKLKADLDAIEPGLTNEAKQALLNCFRHLAWVDGNGQDYYDELEGALNAQIPASALTATLSLDDDKIYESDDIEILRQYLTVTATYTGGTSEAVTNYLLRGTFVAGTSTVSILYGGKTASVSVTVNEGYKLRQEFTATESTGISTGKEIALGETYTIALDVKITGVNATSGTVDFVWGNLTEGANPVYIGLQAVRNASGDYYLYGCGTKYADGKDKLVINSRYRIVHTISFISGNKQYYMYAKNKTSGTSFSGHNESTGTSSFPEGAEIYISKGNSGNGFKGTMYDFVMEPGIWTSEQINAYLAG